MRIYLLFSLFAALVLPCSAFQEKLTLDDIFSSNKFRGSTVADVQWLPNGSAFAFTRVNGRTGQTDIYRHDVRSGQETLILQGDQLRIGDASVTMTAYQTTGQQDLLLITGERRQIWRHSYAAPYYLYDVRNQSLTPLVGGDPDLQNVVLSPHGRLVAYVKDSNLYVAPVDGGTPQQLTNDGSDQVLNGIFDWVYEEEFGRPDAFRWSPDSRRIAFWRTDQTRVRTFYMIDELEPYSKITPLKYPKVGEQNAIVKIGVVDVTSGKTVWMDTGSNDDIYIPRIHWTNSPRNLAIERLSREQNHLELLFGDTKTGKVRRVLEDKHKTWIDVTDDVTFLRERDQLLWTSEKDGFRHIYRSDYDGVQLAQVTKGDWEVTAIYGVDEKNGWIYLIFHEDSSMERHIYRVPLDGGTIDKLSRDQGWNAAVFAPNYLHYVASSSSVDRPTRVHLREANGNRIRVLEENQIPALTSYAMVYPQLMTINTSDGTELNAFMMKPADFDASKKYPVLVFGYGGPGSQMVVNRWGTGGAFRHLQRVLWHQYLTEQGYIVFCVDNRGTGGKGKAFKDLAYGDLSKWAVHDQIEGAKYLKSLPYVDGDRLGFWGWSGGGYLTCMIMTRAADHFKAGIAVASVGDFRNYDTIWTERYMGLLSKNKKGYDAADVLTYTEGLQGELLLIHGSGDDNVHPGNTLQFVDALIAANKQFDLMIYPNRNHRIHGGNTMRHLFTMITEFVLENL